MCFYLLLIRYVNLIVFCIFIDVVFILSHIIVIADVFIMLIFWVIVIFIWFVNLDIIFTFITTRIYFIVIGTNPHT